MSELAELREALRYARAALERYGRHEEKCGAAQDPYARCVCGYHAALNAPVPEQPKSV